MALRPFPDLLAHLRSRLKDPLPGTSAHLRMAPAYRRRPDMLRIEAKPCRESAVLALLFPDGDETTILLTQRRPDLKRHAGQIAFPGGGREPDEPLHLTALRETHEEIGVPPAGIDLIGTLSPLYIPVSNYCVHPFVGVLSSPPEDLILQAAEVLCVHTLRLSDLQHPDARGFEARDIAGAAVQVPVYRAGGLSIWGATAMMLSELIELCDEP